MKKLFSSLLAGAMLFVSANCVYAADSATVTVTKAAYDKTTQQVTVEATITGASETSQSITIMSSGVTAEDQNVADTSETSINFIDQQDNVSITGGKFTTSFSLKAGSDTTGSTRYLVRIGGTGIDTPGLMAIVFNEGGDGPGPSPKIIYGDVNGDKSIDYNDASLLLKYVLNPLSVEIGEENGKLHLKEAKVKNADDDPTSEDVAMILKKAKDSTFEFPVEK